MPQNTIELHIKTSMRSLCKNSIQNNQATRYNKTKKAEYQQVVRRNTFGTVVSASGNCIHRQAKEIHNQKYTGRVTTLHALQNPTKLPRLTAALLRMLQLPISCTVTAQYKINSNNSEIMKKQCNTKTHHRKYQATTTLLNAGVTQNMHEVYTVFSDKTFLLTIAGFAQMKWSP